MRVTLINPRENYDVVLPMGILYVGTVLEEAGHKVQLLDIGPRDKNWQANVKNFNPEIIGLALVTTQYQRAKEILFNLRQICPGAKYCAGGPHPSALPEETLNGLDLDFVVKGEGEYIMKEICEKLNRNKSLEGVRGVYYKNNGQVAFHGLAPVISDMDALPIPKRELLPDSLWYLTPPGFIRGSFNWGIATIMSGRGCPYNCIFCASQNIFGRGVRRRSAQNVMKEIRYLKDKYNIKGLFFLDDTFTVNDNWLKEFCAALKGESYRLIWGCQARGDTITEAKLSIMKDAGCVQVDIGAESGSDIILANLNKLEKVEDLRRGFAIAKKLGIKTFASFIVGNPGEGLAEIEETKKFALEVKPNMAGFCILVPYPGAALYEAAKNNNWFTPAGKEFSKNWSNKQSETPIMAINLPPEVLLKKRMELENLFVWRNHKIILLGFLKNPKYFWQMFFSLFKNFKSNWRVLLESFRTGKARLFVEECYQNFSYDLKVKLSKKYKNF